MNGVLSHHFATVRLYWAGDTWADEMNFYMNNANAAGSIARPVCQHATTVPRMSHNTKQNTGVVLLLNH